MDHPEDTIFLSIPHVFALEQLVTELYFLQAPFICDPRVGQVAISRRAAVLLGILEGPDA
jgi:hypothetical protein